MNTPATPELVQQAIGFYSHSPDGQYDEIAVQALRHYRAALQSQPAAAGVSDDDLRAMWRQHGGMFHGPLIETGTMPEAKLLAFLRAIIALRPQVVPMTDDLANEFASEMVKGGRSVEWLVRKVEAHHGITAHGAQGGEG